MNYIIYELYELWMNYNYDKSPKNRRLSSPKPAPFASHLDVPERPVQEAQLSNFPIIDLLLYDKSPKTGAFRRPNRRLSVLSPWCSRRPSAGSTSRRAPPWRARPGQRTPQCTGRRRPPPSGPPVIRGTNKNRLSSSFWRFSRLTKFKGPNPNKSTIQSDLFFLPVLTSKYLVEIAI